jgi:hypothetical protein
MSPAWPAFRGRLGRSGRGRDEPVGASLYSCFLTYRTLGAAEGANTAWSLDNPSPGIGAIEDYEESQPGSGDAKSYDHSIS